MISPSAARYAEASAQLHSLPAARRLAAAGDVLRRSRALGGSSVPVDEALAELTPAEIAAWLATVDVRALHARLESALARAAEAPLAEDDAERGPLLEVALAGLAERDALSSTVVALDRWAKGGRLLDAEALRLRDRLRAELARGDARLSGRAAWLAGLNEVRRAERDLLDEEHRAAAWWYAERADCDGLAGLLAGGAGAPREHLEACAACRRDHELAALTARPPTRHVSEDELWRYDLGLSPKHEKKWVAAHAAACPACKQAVKALADGDEAIDEAPLPRRAPVEAPAPPDGTVVLLERAELRVVLLRAAKRAHLVVEAKGGHDLHAVEVSVPAAGPARKARRTTRGFELEIAAVKLDAARANIRVEVSRGGVLALEVDLAAATRRRV